MTEGVEMVHSCTNVSALCACEYSVMLIGIAWSVTLVLILPRRLV